MGRGLGFGVKAGDTVLTADVQKTFVLDPGEASGFVQSLLRDTPFEQVEAASDAVARAERELGRSLSRSLTVSVIDHLQYLLKRLDQGIRIPTAPQPELKILFPEEFAAAESMRQVMAAALERPLPEEETVFLTMHLLNATRDEPSSNSAVLFRRLHSVVGLILRGLHAEVDPDSYDYARFLLHMKFLLQRIAGDSLLVGTDSTMFTVASKTYPRSYEVARAAADFLEMETSTQLPDEEVLYLIVHIERLSNVLA